MSAAQWWAGWEEEDRPPTNVVDFRPVVRIRLAVAEGADADEVARTAAARWEAALHGYDEQGNRAEAEFWGAGAGDDALVLGVEIVAGELSVRPSS